MGRRDRPRWATGRPTKVALATRLRFETLLSELSAGLIHVSAGDTDVAIERALQQVVTLLGVDRGGLDEHAEGRPKLRLSWARPGLGESPPVTAADQFPWVSGRLQGGEVVRFSRLEECTAAYSRRLGRVTGSSLGSEWVTVTSDVRPPAR